MDDLRSLSNFVKHDGDISESQFRWWIFNKDKNGIETSGAVVKKQNRWFVNIPKLQEWILEGDKVS